MSPRAQHPSESPSKIPGEVRARAPKEDREDLDSILADWRRRLRRVRDSRPRDGARGARERALTSALLVAAQPQQHGSSEDEESLRKLAMIAALYGADQPRERLDPGALCEELGHLGQAVWRHIRQLRLEPEMATKRILALDRALSIALRAALSGGFRCAPDEVGALAPVTSVTVEHPS